MTHEERKAAAQEYAHAQLSSELGRASLSRSLRDLREHGCDIPFSGKVSLATPFGFATVEVSEIESHDSMDSSDIYWRDMTEADVKRYESTEARSVIRNLELELHREKQMGPCLPHIPGGRAALVGRAEENLRIEKAKPREGCFHIKSHWWWPRSECLACFERRQVS